MTDATNLETTKIECDITIDGIIVDEKVSPDGNVCITLYPSNSTGIGTVPDVQFSVIFPNDSSSTDDINIVMTLAGGTTFKPKLPFIDFTPVLPDTNFAITQQTHSDNTTATMTITNKNSGNYTWNGRFSLNTSAGPLDPRLRVKR